MKSLARILCGIVLLTAFAPPLSASANLTSLSFAQENWFDPYGNEYAPYSLFGRVQVTYTPDATQTYFLNIAAYLPGQSTPVWIVGNLPLLPGTSPYGLMLNFDLSQLGIASGTPVNNLYVAATVNPAVISAMPSGPFAVYGVPAVAQGAWSDVGTVAAPLPDPGPVLGIMLLSPDIYTFASDRDIRPVQEGRLQCFPGATGRSLDWLNRENNLGINKSVDEFYSGLMDRIAPIANDRAFPTMSAKCTEQIRRKDAYAVLRSTAP